MKKVFYLFITAVLFASCQSEPAIVVPPDLQPQIFNLPSALNSPTNFKVRILNNGGETTAPIEFYIVKMTPVATVNVNSSQWTVVEQNTRWKLTSNAGVGIFGGSFHEIDCTFVPTGIGSAGLNVMVVSGTGGGETPTNNNLAVKNVMVQ